MVVYSFLLSHVATLKTHWKSFPILQHAIEKILSSKLPRSLQTSENMNQIIQFDKNNPKSDIVFRLNQNPLKLEWENKESIYSLIYDTDTWARVGSAYSQTQFLNDLHLEYSSRLVLNQIYSIGFNPDNLESKALSYQTNQGKPEEIRIESEKFNNKV